MKPDTKQCAQMAKVAAIDYYNSIGEPELAALQQEEEYDADDVKFFQHIIHAAWGAAEKATARECSEICEEQFRKSAGLVSGNGAHWSANEIRAHFNLNESTGDKS
jgi:hypothetical protein